LVDGRCAARTAGLRDDFDVEHAQPSPERRSPRPTTNGGDGSA